MALAHLRVPLLVQVLGACKGVLTDVVVVCADAVMARLRPPLRLTSSEVFCDILCG